MDVVYRQKTGRKHILLVTPTIIIPMNVIHRFFHIIEFYSKRQ